MSHGGQHRESSRSLWSIKKVCRKQHIHVQELVWGQRKFSGSRKEEVEDLW